MDPLPLIIHFIANQNVESVLRRAFQDTLNGLKFPKDIAENFIQNNVDEELKMKDIAIEVLEVFETLNQNLAKVYNAGYDVMVQQGNYLNDITNIRDVFELKERIRLKRCKLFNRLDRDDVDNFGLLQLSDLFPDLMKQFSDYRMNEGLHLCHGCINKAYKEKNLEKRKKNIENEISKTRQYKVVEKDTVPFVVAPNLVIFHNYKPGKTYKKVLKLINTSPNTLCLSIGKFPKSKNFLVILDQNSKIAPGMTITATVKYRPELYRNLQDSVTFRNNQGYTSTIPISSTRDPPRLITCIYKSTSCLVDRTKPGSKRFQERRREALNSTIDCGSCLVGEYVHLSIVVENKGMLGQFFIITEDEWFYQDIETVSTSLEFSSDSFWLYPTFFEINSGDIMELNVIFQPLKPGFHLERLFVICDNNSFQQLEIVGDAIEFSDRIINIDVPPNDTEVQKKADYCIFLGNIESGVSIPLTLTVHNTSSLFLSCYWKLENKTCRNLFVFYLNKNWIQSKNEIKTLAPYSTTDCNFEINLKSRNVGYHNVYFSFFVENVPLICLEENQEFFILEKYDKEEKRYSELVDVLVMEMEVACYAEIPETPVKLEEDDSPKCKCITCNGKPTRDPKLTFSLPFLGFGILPTGLNVQKKIYVKNLTRETLKWNIVEVRYEVDYAPYMKVVKNASISCSAGIFTSQKRKQSIFYNITNKEPISWVSMLVLFSEDENNKSEIESICIVTYEIINYDIKIRTGQSDIPIICPLKLMYTGVPITLTISIENLSPITGCFYFLKPFGEDADTVDVRFTPRSSVLNPLETKEINVTLTGTEIGIFENLYIPCFIGNGQEPITFRVLCAVDGVHVCFYLPKRRDAFQKIVWPPKVLYEFDDKWMFCPCSLEYTDKFPFNDAEFMDSLTYVDSTSGSIRTPVNTSITESCLDTEPDYIDAANLFALKEYFGECSVVDKSESRTTLTDPEIFVDNKLRLILEEEFGDELFLQEHVIEVQRVPLNTPTKLTFYLENMTPIGTKYAIETTNFSTNKEFDQMGLALKLRRADEIWREVIINDYGILVQPNLNIGDIPGCEFVQIDLWVYANTWGIYSEEVVVDVDDIPCFSFSLLIEVVGCPVAFPMALNCITKYPTVRFGYIPYHSEDIKRKIRITNSSCIPVDVVWSTFLKDPQFKQDQIQFNLVYEIIDKKFEPEGGKLVLMDKKYGKQTCDVIEIIPDEITLNENSSDFIDIIMKPTNFSAQNNETYIRCFVIGHIYIEECHRKKVNYFYRNIDPDFMAINLELMGTLELPLLTHDFICNKTEIVLYANDVVFNNNFKNYVSFLFQNHCHTPIQAEFYIDEPFQILTSKNVVAKHSLFCVEPSSYLEIIVNYAVDHQKILELSELLFKDAVCNNDLAPKRIKYCIDKESNLLHIRKKLKILQVGTTEETIPVDLFMFYPRISAKPTVVKFNNVLIGCTSKTLVSIFNLTGCPVKFEIYKSLSSEEIFVRPHYGEIKGSTGTNKQFVDIFVYFSPRECKKYQESIRVVTNIPKYYIEIPIRGCGAINEKFYVEYKI